MPINGRGFNAAEITECIGGVNVAYVDFKNVLKNDVEQKFVAKMADEWACKQAQEFFAKFKEVLDGLLEDSYNTFKSVVDSVNSAATRWAEQTGDGSVWGKREFSAAGSVKISVDAIQENLDGVRGISDTAKSDALTALDGIYSDATDALAAARRAVDNCGFIGGNQAANLQNSLERIKTKLSNSIQSLKEDVVKAIGETTAAYGELEANVSSAFGGAE